MKAFRGNPYDVYSSPQYMGERASRKTPWGDALSSYEVGDGLTFYETDHHDCWFLSRYLQERMPYRICAGGWYSHHAWFIIVLSFPAFFPESVLEDAHNEFNAVDDAAFAVRTGIPSPFPLSSI